MHTDRPTAVARAHPGQERARLDAFGGLRRRRRECRLGVVGPRLAAPGEHQVLVDLVGPRLGKRERVGEGEAAAAGGEADAAARAPVPCGQRRLDGVGQQDGGVGREAAHDVGGGEPSEPRARIRYQRIREPLPAEQRRPGPREQHARLRMRAA